METVEKNENTSDESVSDEKLIERIRKGDKYAEERILNKYKLLVRKKAASYYMVGADKEDVLQEGMIGVFKAIRDYDGQKGAAFSTFVDMCIQRQLISAVRGANRLKHGPLNDSLSLNKAVSKDEELVGTLGDTISDDRNNDPESLMIMKEDFDIIEKGGIEIFSTLEREVWNMYVQGCSYKEIAERLDKTSKTVDNAIRRAKKKLSELLEL